MIRGFYAAASGLLSQQDHMSIIANNIANLNTTGYKDLQVGFATLFYGNMQGGDGENYVSVGHGARVAQTGIDMTQGEMIETGNDYDYAINGDGFFAVQNPETEEVLYTRAGNFSIKNDGDTLYLVDINGNGVLNADGDAIEITSDADEASMTPGVYTFTNPYALKLMGGNTFSATTLSGDAEAVDYTDTETEHPALVSGYLEGSGTEVALEMAHMIEASKSFSLNAKIVQAADDMEKLVNQMR